MRAAMHQYVPPRDSVGNGLGGDGAGFVAGLLDEAWEVGPRLVRGGWPDPAALFDCGAFEDQILADRGDVSRTNCIVEGIARPLLAARAVERLDIAARLYADGCSLIQVGVEERSSALAALCRSIDFELLRGGVALSDATSANAYLGPAGASGLPLHYDDHCVVIIQLDGTKHWAIHPPSDPLPVTRCEGNIAREALEGACLEAVIAPGDMLYVPRGFPHVARSGSTGSLHVTLALRTITWGALLDADSDGVGPISGRSARIRGDHFNSPCGPEAGPMLEARIARALSDLRPLVGARFAAIDAIPAIGPDTPLKHAPHTMLIDRTEGAEALLHYPGAVLRLPVAMAPVFAFVVAHKCFAARDMPDVAVAYDKSELVRALIRRGLLVPARPA